MIIYTASELEIVKKKKTERGNRLLKPRKQKEREKEH